MIGLSPLVLLFSSVTLFRRFCENMIRVTDKIKVVTDMSQMIKFYLLHFFRVASLSLHHSLMYIK